MQLASVAASFRQGMTIDTSIGEGAGSRHSWASRLTAIFGATS
jgi:hypothetical protein